jgi:hypothetical protein
MSEQFVLSGQTEKTPYGVNEIGRPQRCSEGGGYERIDRWTADSDGRVELERRFANGPDDLSPMARLEYAGKGNYRYHPKCACCWLGFSHTLAAHNTQTDPVCPTGLDR